jgi:hypothetical protein
MRADRPSTLSRGPQARSAGPRVPYNTARFPTLTPIEAFSPDVFSPRVKEPIIDLNVTATVTVSKPLHAFHGQDITINITPPLPPLDSPQFPASFEQKVTACSTLCRLNFLTADSSAKIAKLSTLDEIANFPSDSPSVSALSSDQIALLLNMIAVNVCRPLGNCNPLLLIGDECPDCPLPQWPHLSVVYVILLKLLEHRPTDFSLDFVDTIIYLLNSESESERMQIKFFLGGFCVQFPDLQDQVMIRLIRMLFNHREHIIPPFGLPSILEILLELFQLRRRETALSTVIFRDHILPLVSNRYFSFFVAQFTRILTTFHAADPVNGALFIDAVSSRWPRTHISKQIYLLTILTSIIPHLSRRDFSARLAILFRIYSEATASVSSKLAEAALALWDSLEFQALVGIYAQQILPLIVPSLIVAAKDHWCPAVQLAATKALQFVSKTDYRALTEATFRIMSTDRISPWMTVATEAARQDALIRLPEVVEELRRLKNLGSIYDRPDRAASVPRMPAQADLVPHIVQPKLK